MHTGDFINFSASWWSWVGLLGVLTLLLAIDLVVHRQAHAPSIRRAAGESAVWIACGLAFGVFVWHSWGGAAAGEYFSGYIIEKSLSVDNVFVWAVIFTSFQIPLELQHRVLFWGIFAALMLRAIFIFGGTALLATFWWMLFVFGGFLLYTGIKVLHHKDGEGETSHQRIVALASRFLPVQPSLDGQRFTTLVDGRRVLTLLALVLVVIEFTDVIFALDSVPAVLAVSHEPFLVFASNAFAILGLRALYFLLAAAKDRLHYLSHALGVILILVGAKMCVAHWVHIPTALSLAAILTLLVAAIGASMWRTRGQVHSDGGVAPIQ